MICLADSFSNIMWTSEESLMGRSTSPLSEAKAKAREVECGGSRAPCRAGLLETSRFASDKAATFNTAAGGGGGEEGVGEARVRYKTCW
jgi:hypothetical protein